MSNNYNNNGAGGAAWGDDSRMSNAAKHNPFTGGKSGPPVFYRSKAAPTGDEREPEAPGSRV